MELALAAPFSGRLPDFALPLWRPVEGGNALYVVVADASRRIVDFEHFDDGGACAFLSRVQKLTVEIGESLPYVFAFRPDDIVVGDKPSVATTIAARFAEIEPYIFASVPAALFADMQDQMPHLNRRAFETHRKFSPVAAQVWRDVCVLLPAARAVLAQELGIRAEQVLMDRKGLVVGDTTGRATDLIKTIIVRAWQQTGLSAGGLLIRVTNGSLTDSSVLTDIMSDLVDSKRGGMTPHLLTIVDEIPTEAFRSRALAAVVTNKGFSEDLALEVLERVEAMGDDWAKVRTLTPLLSVLSEEWLKRVVSIVSSLKNDWAKVRLFVAFSRLALPSDIKQELRNITGTIRDHKARTRATKVLAAPSAADNVAGRKRRKLGPRPALNERSLQAWQFKLKWYRNRKRNLGRFSRAKILTGLSQDAPEELISDVMSEIKDVKDSPWKARAFVAIGRRAAEIDSSEIFAEVRAILEKMTNVEIKSSGLAALVRAGARYFS